MLLLLFYVLNPRGVLLLSHCLLIPQPLHSILNTNLRGDPAFLVEPVEFYLSDVVSWLVQNTPNEANNLNALKANNKSDNESDGVHFSISINVLMIVPWTGQVAALKLVDRV